MYNYSPEDLIQYLYNETTPETTAAIDLALQKDWTLREKLSVLKLSAERLNSIKVSPRTEIILSVLKYAAKEEAISTSK